MEPKRTDSSGFTHVQWTTFRKSRILVVGTVVAVMVTVLLGLGYAAGSNDHVSVGCGGSTVCSSSSMPTGELVGPNGEAVEDKFYFVYQPLAGNGSITARLTSMTGEFAYLPPNANPNVPSIVLLPGVQPWAKAGVMIKESTTQGSAYAAMMITGSHGVRMQDNFTHDIAGIPGDVSEEFPRWLRLTREGSTLTGYDSTDGTQWTRVGTAHLAGLPATVQVGLFVTSPCVLTVEKNGSSCRFAQATAVFDHVSLQGEAPRGAWSRDDVGVLMVNGKPHHPGSLVESGGTFTVTGNGDIVSLGTTGGIGGGRFIERTLRRSGRDDCGDRGCGAVRYCRRSGWSNPRLKAREPEPADVGRDGSGDWGSHIHDAAGRRYRCGPAWQTHHALERRCSTSEPPHRTAHHGRDCGGCQVPKLLDIR